LLRKQWGKGKNMEFGHDQTITMINYLKIYECFILD
jgi:hypothetical protein